VFHETFYFGLLRKYVSLVGTLFNDLVILRNEGDGTTIPIRVPITYGPKDKMLARVFEDPNLDRKTAVYPIPALSFEMTGLRYDPERKLQTTGYVARKTTDADMGRKYFNPSPWNFEFEVNLYVKNVEDGAKVIEQILPYFTPDWTVNVNLIPDLGVRLPIPVVLRDVSYRDDYEGEVVDRRKIVWTLSLTVKGWLYSAPRDMPLIKFANVSTWVATSSFPPYVEANATPVWSIDVRPGLTANGTPTSDPDQSIPVDQIEITDDFGYVETVTYG
jgi:hypothetical protein